MTGRAMMTLGAAAIATACGGRDARTDTAATADSAVQAARAVVDSSVPLPDTLTPTAPADTALERGGARDAPVQEPAKVPAKEPAKEPAKVPATPKPASGGKAPASAPSAASRSDTLRGKPAVVGSAPFTQVALRPAAGGSVTITGPLAREIGRASGADVWVRGSRTDRGFEVTDYRVRAVDGVPALDGVLVVDGENAYLRLADGSRPLLRSAPAALRAEAGARVWVTGGVDQPVAAYGVLRPRD